MHSEEQRAEWRAHNQRRRKRARKFGICTTCLSRQAEKDSTSCSTCKERRRGKS